MATVLLIPGLLCDRFSWGRTPDRLPDAVVVDLAAQDSITRMAQDQLDAYPGPLRVAGHSMGARVAIEMARLAPERIERLALLDTGTHALKPTEPDSRAEIVLYAHDHGMRALAERWLPPMVWEGNRQNAALMQGLTDMVLRMDAERHARQIKALVNRPDAQSHLPSLTCPVLLVVGRYDAWSPVSQHEDIKALIPHARLEIIEDAGHFAPVEQPEAVADLLADFLE